MICKSLFFACTQRTGSDWKRHDVCPHNLVCCQMLSWTSGGTHLQAKRALRLPPSAYIFTGFTAVFLTPSSLSLNMKPICCGRHATQGPDLVTLIQALLENSEPSLDQINNAMHISKKCQIEKRWYELLCLMRFDRSALCGTHNAITLGYNFKNHILIDCFLFSTLLVKNNKTYTWAHIK